MKNCSRFFKNTDCEYFPCHDTDRDADFNCLFCYCPLYRLEDCGGNAQYTDDGIKDCSACTLPHRADNYDYIVQKLSERI